MNILKCNESHADVHQCKHVHVCVLLGYLYLTLPILKAAITHAYCQVVIVFELNEINE